MSSYGPLAGFYDALTGDIPYEEFADFYESVFAVRRENTRTVLDLACGTGTMTCILARRGYEMISVDASAEMLSEAAEKAAGLSGCIPPMLLCQTMEELDLYGTVDAAVCSLDSINYLPTEALPETFHRLSLFIEPGGVLIFDINSPQRLRSLDGETFVDESEDLLCLWRADFDEEENLLFYGMDIFTLEGELWRRESEEHIEYAHEPDELAALLEANSFTDIEICHDGPQHDQGRLFFIAKRK